MSQTSTRARHKYRLRRLHPWEVAEARKVFGDSLNYEKVRLHEGAVFTNWIDQIGQRLKGIKPHKVQNAITLGNHCLFPEAFPTHPVLPGDPEHTKIGWLIHELTHTWQFQHMGWAYLFQALKAQFKAKGNVYDFGHEDGLKRRRREGWKVNTFSLEQQGEICRGYYEKMCRGEDLSSWEPYIEEVRQWVGKLKV